MVVCSLDKNAFGGADFMTIDEMIGRKNELGYSC